MLAQILQKIANGKIFEPGQSNQHLAVMNRMIETNTSRLYNMYHIIEQRALLLAGKPVPPPLSDEEAANTYRGDEAFERLYEALVSVHGVLHECQSKNARFTKMTTEQLSLYPDRARKEPGFDPVSAMIELEVVLDALGHPSEGGGVGKMYGQSV